MQSCPNTTPDRGVCCTYTIINQFQPTVGNNTTYEIPQKWQTTKFLICTFEGPGSPSFSSNISDSSSIALFTLKVTRNLEQRKTTYFCKTDTVSHHLWPNRYD